MAGSSDWPIERLALSELRLDPANVRIRGTIDDEDAILTHLLQRHDAMALVRDIARDGYFDNEQPIVYTDDQNRPIVLEGNRRVTALKVLNDPHRIAEFSQRVLAAIARSDDSNFPTRIRVMIAPSKASALQVLARLHTRDSKKSWVLEQQATFYYDRIRDGETLADLRAEYPAEASKIARFVVMGQLMDLARWAASTDPVAGEFIDSTEFKMTTFEYLYNISTFRTGAGMVVASDARVSFIGHSDEFRRRLFVQILLDMKDKRINTRNVKLSDPDFPAYLTSLLQIASGQKDSHIESVESTSSEAEPGSSAGTEGDDDAQTTDVTKGADPETASGTAPASNDGRPAEQAKRAPNRHLYDQKLDFSGMPLRLPELGLRIRCDELRRINVKDFPNATYDIMRTFIECAIKVYFDTCDDSVVALDGRGGPIQLKDCLAFLENRLGKHPVVNRTLAILKRKQFNSPDHYLASAQAFNNSNHDPSTVFDQEHVNAMWAQLKPLVKLLLDGPPETDEVP